MTSSAIEAVSNRFQRRPLAAEDGGQPLVGISAGLRARTSYRLASTQSGRAGGEPRGHERAKLLLTCQGRRSRSKSLPVIICRPHLRGPDLIEDNQLGSVPVEAPHRASPGIPRLRHFCFGSSNKWFRGRVELTSLKTECLWVFFV
ncbi:hypothetical protein J6590_011448 [Homalodisca vitripennis]|nr:hypothetical protein J6590_011448 [Homalodisca vitripennis]